MTIQPGGRIKRRKDLAICVIRKLLIEQYSVEMAGYPAGKEILYT